MKTIDEYMSLPYRMEITKDESEGGYVISYPVKYVSPFFTSDSDEVYFSVENIDGNLVISECNLIFYPKY